ncbi:MAG TPA: hypothetical protein QF802_03595 [Candidatus Thalassarchaeaceae archaeon]|jgi:hypothetical protein|nr:hypothetical protein [Candidatus Thalassarchaeaceae archaeon]HJM19519.1 hypothetical protein [Candidatus Thalassarchaeaceae archaeon]
MDSEIRTLVHIADLTGHAEMELTKAETMDVINQHDGAWVFTGNRLVQPAELEAANWAEIGTVRVMPPMVGGQY